ncbi:MAG: hypothetical protein AAGM16_09850 [Pseudomonadota bacterium]
MGGRSSLWPLGVCLVAASALPAAAQAESPHHVSLLLGATELVDEGDVGFTYGIDYEYALDERLGLGFVIERAEGDVGATSLFAVADIHLSRHLVLQVGPGFEWGEAEDVGAFRVGGYYEWELDEMTFATTLSYDIADGEDDSVVIGFLIGFKF